MLVGLGSCSNASDSARNSGVPVPKCAAASAIVSHGVGTSAAASPALDAPTTAITPGERCAVGCRAEVSMNTSMNGNAAATVCGMSILFFGPRPCASG